MGKTRAVGRPCKYDEYVKPYLELIVGWVARGISEDKIAENLGIARSSFYLYKQKYSDLSNALKPTRELMDMQVEKSLFKAAQGYEYEEVKQIVETVVDARGKATGEKRIKSEKTKKWFPPNPTAQIFWLKNRQHADWHDRTQLDINASVGLVQIVDDIPGSKMIQGAGNVIEIENGEDSDE